MTKPPVYQVPFDRSGALMHWADSRKSAYTSDKAAEWRDPEPFQATLRVIGIQRGRSAAYFRLADDLARCWPMFMKEILELVQVAVINQGTVEGWWIPVKRGQNFGLRYLGPEEPE